MPVRTYFRVPDTRSASDKDDVVWETHGAIATALNLLNIKYTITPDLCYAVVTHGRVVKFAPNDWMLFNLSGVYRVAPVHLTALNAGDYVVGLKSPYEADIWDAVMTLATKPQMCGGMIRLVPEPSGTYPSSYRMGVTYASPAERKAWKVLEGVPD